MTYVISDLHGYPLEKLKKLLAKANFSEDDFLYILGDVVDKRGDGGVSILEWIMTQPNVQFILGNHEDMLLGCEFIFTENIIPQTLKSLSKQKAEKLDHYLRDGGNFTLKALIKFNKKHPERVSQIFDFLRNAPVYKELTIGDKKFLLTHSGIDDFRKRKALSAYPKKAFYTAWPEITDEYFDDVMTVFGHTPTSSFGNEYFGKTIKTKTWIAIDMGSGGEKEVEPVLLRLDDMAEFRN